MIVTRRDGCLELVEQVEHGRIAGALAGAWGNEVFGRPDPHPAVQLAAARHDEGWRAWDGAVLFHEIERRPQHFLEIDASEHITLYRAGVQQVSMLDVYAGLLVGMHWSGLYRGRWSRPGGGSRLQRSEGDRRRQDEVVHDEERRWIEAKHLAWRDEEPRSVFESKLWHNYDLLQLCDLLSLYLCVMPAEPGGGAVTLWGPQLRELEHQPEIVSLPPIAVSPGGHRLALTVSVRVRGEVTVDPFPFAGALELEVAHRRLPDRGWTHDEAVDLLARTPLTVSRWQLVPPHAGVDQ